MIASKRNNQTRCRKGGEPTFADKKSGGGEKEKEPNRKDKKVRGEKK